MTALTVEDLRGRYDLLNTGDINAIVAQFAPNAEYRQLDGKGDTVVLGHDKIRGVMVGWRRCFGDGLRIENIIVREARRLVDVASGASKCFTADFVGVGVYQNTVPGLEDIAPAHRRPVRVPIGETVWVNDRGQIIRVDNTMNIAALR